LADIYVGLADSAEEHDRARAKVRRVLTPNLQHHLDAGGSPLALAPFPVTFAAFLRMLSDAAIDPEKRGYRAGVANGGTRLDDRDVLMSAVPDLRGVRRAELSGHVSRVEH
jgi:hypothetical protein